MTNSNKLSDLCKFRQSDDKTEKEFREILSFLAPKEREYSSPWQAVLDKEPARLREDSVEKSLAKSQVLALAPETDKGYIAIPRALEEA